MSLKRLMSLMTALTLLLAFSVPAYSETVTFAEPIIRSAPLTRSGSTLNGMVRVYMSSMGNVTSLDVTVVGSYSVDGANRMTLYDGQTVKVGFNTSTGQITLTANGSSYAMGKEIAFRRHQANGESALKIAQANRPNNLYPGDLQLTALTSGSGYKLYPIIHVYMENYLYGVVPYEMSSSSPLEALKAQAVAARTYTLNRMNGRTSYIYDLVDTASAQVFNGYSGSESNATRAVDATKGIVIMNNGKLSGTYYTASNGGQTEAVANIWGSTAYGYLGVKDDPYDLANTGSPRKTLTVYSTFNHASQSAKLQSLLTAKAKSIYGSGVSITTINSVTPHTPKYPSPSRLYTKLDFGVTLSNGSSATLTFSIFDELESPLSMSHTSSKNELWSVSRDGSTFVISAGRYGHGVGMSQRGAQQMARMGYSYDQILGFYYEGCERIQHTFTHTILPSIGSGDDPVVSTEAPATIEPDNTCNARISLVGIGDSLPLRYTPSETGKVLITATNGASVNVINYGSKWTLIRYGQICGYVPTNNLVITGTPPTDSGAAATNISQWATANVTDSLNLRDGASYSSNVIGSLPSAGVVAILSYGSTWCQVQYGQQVGYAATSYLNITSTYPGNVEVSGSSAMVSLPGGIGSAPLRSTASTSGTVILYVDHGTQVTVISNDGSWCRVSVSGVTGYMLSSALDFDATGVTPTDEPLGNGERYAIVASDASTLNLRTGPATSYDVIAEIPRGTQIVVTSYGSEWCAVRWGSLTGYVMTSYLRFDAESTTAAPTATPTATNVLSGAPALIHTNSDLYTSASTGSDIQLLIPSGETVTVLDYGETWSQISYVGLTGYVLTSTLQLYQDMETTSPATPTPTAAPSATPTATPTPTPAPTYVPCDATATVIMNAHLREKDSTGSTLLATIPAGSTVSVTATGTSWCQVIYNGMIGWMLTTQLHIQEESTPTPNPEATETAAPAEDEVIQSTLAPVQDGLSAWIVSTVTNVNLRASASPDADVYTTIEGGSPVTVLNQASTWSLISHGGREGYVYTRHITYTEPMEAIGMRYVSTASDPLALRNAPSTSGTILTRMERGSKVTLLEELDDWCHVQYGQYIGYCASRYLSADKPAARVIDDTPLLDYTLTEVTGWEAVVNEGGSQTIFIRQWCSTDAPEVAEILPDTRVSVVRKGNIWCLIKSEGNEGYCLTSQLTLISPTD